MEEFTKAINPKDKSISPVSQDPFVSKSEMKQVIRDEFRELNLILEILVVEAVDKIFIGIEVKMLLIGNLSSRETEVRPCLVTK